MVKSEIKIEGKGFEEKIIRLRWSGMKPSSAVLIVGEPGFSPEMYSETLGSYLAKKGFDTWIVSTPQKSSFSFILSASLKAITTHALWRDLFLICHGFSCLPFLEEFSSSGRIKAVLMISPPLFSWQWSSAFIWFLTNYRNGGERLLEEIPSFSRSGESLFSLLFGSTFDEREISFIKSKIVPIDSTWLEFMKSYTGNENAEFIKKYCEMKIPSITIAGQGDGFIPYWSSVPPSMYRKECKGEFWFFGRANFHRKEYGHLEMLVGEDAREEVFTYILKWLKYGWRKSNWMKEEAGFPGE